MATQYTFTQPIRYYKANDPYYYEVDNIPLRQLEENILYLKEKLSLGSGSGEGGGGFLTENSEIDLNNIKQLKPKAGGGRTVTVNAGKYMARVNDAFNISNPLNKLIFKDGTPPQSPNILPVLEQSWTSAQRDAVWDKFIGTTAASNSFNTNGLEIAYTFYATPGGLGTSFGWTATGIEEGQWNFPKYAGLPTQEAAKWPNATTRGPITPEKLGTLIDWGVGGSWNPGTLPSLHLAFVQMWRGVFRTSVVDFPDAEAQVEPWSEDDFYYKDDSGTKIQLNATQRIDLLVAHTVPIDSSGTTLPDYAENYCGGTTPKAKTITTPTLSIIRGAGIGISKNDVSIPPSIDTLEGCDEPTNPAGKPRLVPNKSDNMVGANIGLTTINGSKVHGSFPSPDDLLNLAPTIALDLAADDFQLIGQTVLPLAYIVVKKGQNDIVSQDIIDIRPFLRTTEFTYNERAGIAAANPPLSFANPAVGAYQLQTVINTLNEQQQQNLPSQSGRALYTDYIMGGLAYGVEGTLLTMCDHGNQGTNDPFGSVTNQASPYTDPAGNGTVNWSNLYTSPKAFLEDTDLSRREGFLQYVYQNRQADLKRWLLDPTRTWQQNQETYLGLPAGNTGRNIPLYPEWDMPMDGTNYAQLMGLQGNNAIPKVTWWMWFEAAGRDRSLAYAPGGVVGGTANVPHSYLQNRYGFGWGDNLGNGFINVVTKRLVVTFPSWVNDYDVMVNYVNCGPVTTSTAAGGQSQSRIQNGFGSGLSVYKGPVISTPGGDKQAVFYINSSSQNLIIDSGQGDFQNLNSGMIGSQNGGNANGVITDKKSPVPGNGAEAPFENNAEAGATNWLSYTVACPQFRQTKWATQTQTTLPTNTMRWTPKFGAAYYPTVSFTLIGYESKGGTFNMAYNPSNNYTMLQDVVIGDSGNLMANTGPVNTANTQLNITRA